MLPHIRLLPAPESDDEGRLAAAHRLVRVRSQLAVVRTLADRAEYLTRLREDDEVDERLVEEMARLGCRLLEAAAWLTTSHRSGESGPFAVVGSGTER